MKKLLTITSLVVIYAQLISQAQTVHRCATHEIYEQNVRKHPGYAEAVENAFNYARNYAQQAAARKMADASDTVYNQYDTIYRIPVVVHIVYDASQENIDDSLAYNQIEVLNEDYRRQNADTGNTRSIFKSRAADAKIEFFLAATDTAGNPTTGITRTHTTHGPFGDDPTMAEVKYDSLGGVDAWDTKKYLNIWVCNLELSFLPGVPFILGYAFPPDNAPNWPDSSYVTAPELHGVVIHYAAFGRNNPAGTGVLSGIADRGRTVTHEVGHYLGLRHIWGDGNNGVFGTTPDCSVDDGISDTPNAGTNSQNEATSATGCDIVKNTCTDPVDDLPDMWENYMDYSKESCQNLFTTEQVSIMRAMLATSRMELPTIVIRNTIVIRDTIVVHDTITDTVPTFFVYQPERVEFAIAPNPSDGKVAISFYGNNSPGEIIVNDLFGKEWNTFSFDGSRKTVLHLETLPKGIYAITVKTQSGQFGVKKIVLN